MSYKDKVTKQNTTKHKTTRQHNARNHRTRQDTTRQDKTRQDKTRQHNTVAMELLHTLSMSMPSWNVMRKEGLRYLIGSNGYCWEIIFSSCWNLDREIPAVSVRDVGLGAGKDGGKGCRNKGRGERKGRGNTEVVS